MTASSPTPARLLRFALRATLLLGLLHLYIGWSLLPAWHLSAPGWTVGILMLVTSALLVPLGLFARFLFSGQALVDRLTLAGTLLMGLFSTLFVLTLLRDLLRWTLTPSLVSDTAMAVPLLALLITFIGYVNVRRLPRVVSVDIPLPNLPPQLAGFTLVQISDIHVGPTLKRAYVEGIVQRVNLLNADVVVITGDVVDGGVAQLTADTAPLAGLKARQGCFIVTGNHEYYSGAAAWVTEFRRLGLTPLMNAHVVLTHAGASLVLAGVTDFNAELFDATQKSDPVAALAGSPAGIPRILLAHQPRSADAAEAAGFDLQLSGHTHGGQFWPWNHLVRLQQPYTAGLHRHGTLWVYTSRGTGYWGPPKRFGAPAEITRIRLQPTEVSP
jgi:predicted MPP superfamily phosphohydrolase